MKSSYFEVKSNPLQINNIVLPSIYMKQFNLYRTTIEHALTKKNNFLVLEMELFTKIIIFIATDVTLQLQSVQMNQVHLNITRQINFQRYNKQNSYSITMRTPTFVLYSEMHNQAVYSKTTFSRENRYREDIIQGLFTYYISRQWERVEVLTQCEIL